MLMTCPKCGGSGKTWSSYGTNSSAAPSGTICGSCDGSGYVTDGCVGSSIQPAKCNKCGKEFTITWVCGECQLAEINLKKDC